MLLYIYMKKALTLSTKVQKILIFSLSLTYTINVATAVIFIAQNYFFVNIPTPLLVDLYTTILFTPIIFVVSYFMINKSGKSLLDRYSRAALVSFSALFFSQITSIITYFIFSSLMIDLGIYVWLLPAVITFAIFLLALIYNKLITAKKGLDYSSNLIQKSVIVISFFFLLSFITLPIWEVFANIINNTPENIFWGDGVIFYYNLSPLVLAAGLIITGHVLTKNISNRPTRMFTIFIGAAIAMLLNLSIQQIANLFVSDVELNIYRTITHIVSYIVSICFFLHFIKAFKRSK